MSTWFSVKWETFSALLAFERFDVGDEGTS